MKKNYLIVLMIVAFFFTISATLYVPQKEGEGFKNLKVLPKDISKERLDSVMGHFSVSLGVKCNFCHASNPDTTQKRLDFASDKKEEKNTAREMFRMTSYLNANFFNDEHSNQTDTIHAVVCYSCHRGTKEPDSKVFLSLIDSTLQAQRKNRVNH
jgi:hypothetical protein